MRRLVSLSPVRTLPLRPVGVRPTPTPPTPPTPPTRAAWQETAVAASRLVGNGIVWCVFLYASLNYIHYRGLREALEEEEDKNEKDRKD